MNSIFIDGLSFTLPLFIMAIGGIFCERSGITMLAIEGLQGFGAFCGAFVAVMLQGVLSNNSQIPFYAAVLVAAIGGGLFSLIHAALCLKFRANQVISGVAVNILAVALTTYLTKIINKIVFDAPSDKFVLNVCGRFSIPGLSSIPVIGALFKKMYSFEIIIIVVALICWLVLYKSRYGMHLRACGDNPHAVDTVGSNVVKVRLVAIVICGMLSGIGGICFAYSIFANFSSSIYLGYGYLAIAALIFGNWKIMPTFLACVLFGFARSGGYQLVQALELPSSFQDIIMILPYVLTLILLIFFSKNNGAPRALGVVYDKGSR